jgi:hypothetical protein
VQYDYAFHVKGRLTPVLKAALDPLEAADTSAGTVLVANAADRAALHGFVARIEALGLNLVELQRIPAPDDNGGHRCLACGCRQGPEGAQRVRDRVAVARGTGLTTLTIAAAPGPGTRRVRMPCASRRQPDQSRPGRPPGWPAHRTRSPIKRGLNSCDGHHRSPPARCTGERRVNRDRTANSKWLLSRQLMRQLPAVQQAVRMVLDP